MGACGSKAKVQEPAVAPTILQQSASSEKVQAEQPAPETQQLTSEAERAADGVVIEGDNNAMDCQKLSGILSCCKTDQTAPVQPQSVEAESALEQQAADEVRDVAAVDAEAVQERAVESVPAEPKAEQSQEASVEAVDAEAEVENNDAEASVPATSSRKWSETLHLCCKAPDPEDDEIVSAGKPDTVARGQSAASVEAKKPVGTHPAGLFEQCCKPPEPEDEDELPVAPTDAVPEEVVAEAAPEVAPAAEGAEQQEGGVWRLAVRLMGNLTVSDKKAEAKEEDATAAQATEKAQ